MFDKLDDEHRLPKESCMHRFLRTVTELGRRTWLCTYHFVSFIGERCGGVGLDASVARATVTQYGPTDEAVREEGRQYGYMPTI